jgi:hypothetical protein
MAKAGPHRERGWRATKRCGDCGVQRGGYHHLGCDIQECPVCGRQMLSCDCRFDEDGPDDESTDDGFDDDDLSEVVLGEPFIDTNGCLAERRWLGDQEVIVHDDDVPDSDITTIDGIRCTTALRTVVDLAPELDHDHLVRIVQDCFARRLFTLDDARARLDQEDMKHRRGAELLRQVLPEPPSV